MKRYFATANSTPGAGSATTETVFDIFFIRAFKANRILKTFLFAITFLTLMMVSQNVDAQCACPKPIYPQSVLTPTCTEQSLNVGHRHYYPIQVTAGVWYDIHTCSSNFDSQLGGFNGASCVFFNDNNGPICGGTRASVRWKATFSGNLDVAVRRNFCADIAGIHNAVLSYKISTPTTADAGPDQTVCGLSLIHI